MRFTNYCQCPTALVKQLVAQRSVMGGRVAFCLSADSNTYFASGQNLPHHSFCSGKVPSIRDGTFVASLQAGRACSICWPELSPAGAQTVHTPSALLFVADAFYKLWSVPHSCGARCTKECDGGQQIPHCTFCWYLAKFLHKGWDILCEPAGRTCVQYFVSRVEPCQCADCSYTQSVPFCN